MHAMGFVDRNLKCAAPPPRAEKPGKPATASPKPKAKGKAKSAVKPKPKKRLRKAKSEGMEEE